MSADRKDMPPFLTLLVVLIAANAAYATAVPTILDEFDVPVMPHGYRESTSPEGEAYTTFTDIALDIGITHTRYAWTDGDLPYVAVIGGGVAAGDIDNDGWTDLYFPPGGPDHPAHLYRNLGDWRFQDITVAAGLDATGFGTGAVFGDYDNDGDRDLYTFIDDQGVLYTNQGDGTFTDTTTESGLTLEGACGRRPCQASSMAWLDHDTDGDLDLFIVNNLDWREPRLHTSGQDYASLIYFATEQVSLLYENEGPNETGVWTFSDITDLTEVDNDGGKGLGVALADFDDNGHPDIATANDITENSLYLNHGDGAYDNVASKTGASEVKTSMGIVAEDMDGDLRPDLVITNFRGDRMSLLLQDADGHFTHRTEENGLGATWRGTGWGVAALDIDLDGWLDIAHGVGRAVPLKPNELHNIVFSDLLPDREDQLFRNLGNGMFAEVTYDAGSYAGNTTTRAVLAVDLDNDGDEDIVRVNVQGQNVEVLRNDRETDHASLQLDLVGTSGNRDAYGARILVTTADGRTQMRELTSAAGYQTGLDHVITFGLGTHASAEVTIRWPGGATETITLDAGRHTVVEDGQ